MIEDIVHGEIVKPYSELWIIVYYSEGSDSPLYLGSSNKQSAIDQTTYLIRDKSRPVKLFKLVL